MKFLRRFIVAAFRAILIMCALFLLGAGMRWIVLNATWWQITAGLLIFVFFFMTGALMIGDWINEEIRK
jgi:hypothetical protein